MDNILFDTIVNYKNKDIKLSINDKGILLEKKKLFFKDKYKIIDYFDIDDIITYKNKIQVISNKENITIKTKNKKYNFICNSSKESKKILDLIMELKTGKTKLERTSNKAIKVSRDTVKVIKAIRGFGSAALVIASTINKHRDEFRELYNSIKDSIKK